MNYNLKAKMSKFLKEFIANNYTHTHTHTYILFPVKLMTLRIDDIKVNRGLVNLNYQIINYKSYLSEF